MQITGKLQQAMNYRNDLSSWVKRISMIPAKCALTLGSRGYQKKHGIFSHGSGILTFSHYLCDVGKEISPP